MSDELAPLGVACPTCRLFSDLVPAERAVDARSVPIRCPWCGSLSTLADWLTCAERETCDACSHPRAMHASYGTNDGEAPRPTGTMQHVTVSPAPCAHCGCTACHGANLVRLA